MSVIETSGPVRIETPLKVCNPWANPIRCPLFFFVILAILGLILNIASIVNADVDQGQKLLTIAVGSLLYLVVIFFFGLWMKRLCQGCQFLSAWGVFLLAAFLPFVLAIIFAIITSFIMGTSSLFFAFA